MEWICEAISQYGYAALYLLLALGIVGLPVPDEILMTLVGYLPSIFVLQYIPSLMVCFAGTMTGMTVSYCLFLGWAHSPGA
ncbi:hypothetical protein M3650_03825 [Paenibacillus sp. MER TA 81-3]|uniref:hypothetical protein n=1 Tax=Paenibacillus sp. MER TA 81-3 TaxID=2939573 RepID=UPI00203C43D8|nr:hypothetical protein [Paenibacillus sp. MER TA 81-3]MCM3337785.1 hypothetical protein [Paenibacillus sp. MER TA 81-3]